MYCGSDIVVREAINLAGGVNIDNLLMLAKMAEEKQNGPEADKYYAQVLEHDSQNVIAWIGRGKIEGFTGWTDYTKTCFRNALSFALDKDKVKQQLIKMCEDIWLKPLVFPTGSNYFIFDRWKICEGPIDFLNEIDPDNIYALFLMGGITCIKERQYTKAIQYFEKALSLSDHNKEIKGQVFWLTRQHLCSVFMETMIHELLTNGKELLILLKYFDKLHDELIEKGYDNSDPNVKGGEPNRHVIRYYAKKDYDSADLYVKACFVQALDNNISWWAFKDDETSRSVRTLREKYVNLINNWRPPQYGPLKSFKALVESQNKNKVVEKQEEVKQKTKKKSLWSKLGI
jgi:tetratricopeptide (TPR) repeat protein